MQEPMKNVALDAVERRQSSPLSSLSCLFLYNRLLSIHDGSGTMFNMYRLCTHSSCIFLLDKKFIRSDAIKLSLIQPHGKVAKCLNITNNNKLLICTKYSPMPALNEVFSCLLMQAATQPITWQQPNAQY